MPTELRRLIFETDELIDAIWQYDSVANQTLPVGRIAACTPLGGANVAVRIDVETDTSEAPVTVDFTPEVAAAALVRYCMSHKIPLPHRAKKSLRVHDGKLVLDVYLHIEGKGPAPGSEPEASG